MVRTPPCSFLLCGSGCPCVLHSFPTRRSSDLGNSTPPKSPPFPWERGHFPPPCPSSLASHCGRDACAPTDRKSTRLNSSHVSISYAVFCLKKKTTRGHERGIIKPYSRCEPRVS